MPKCKVIKAKQIIEHTEGRIIIPPKEIFVPTVSSTKKYSTYELMMRFGFDPVRALFFTN